jgi:magnesium chelatase family protein
MGTDIIHNADMRIAIAMKSCKLDETCDNLIRATMSKLNLSAWAYHWILKLARTISEQAGSEHLQTSRRAKLLQYRPKGMMG